MERVGVCWFLAFIAILSSLSLTGGTKNGEVFYEIDTPHQLEAADYNVFFTENLAPLLRHRRQVPLFSNTSQSTSSSTPSATSTTTSTTTTTAVSTTTNVTVSTTTSKGGGLVVTSSTPPSPTPVQPNTTTSSTSTVEETTQAWASTTSTTELPFTREAIDAVYYKYKVVDGDQAKSLWVDLPKDGHVTHGKLSGSHRTAATISLTFTFLFYGHEVSSATIATGGFIYTNNITHRFLTYSNYVAPLMANFDSRIGNDSLVHFWDNGFVYMSSFVHPWLTASQYIAPLMANFDSQLGNQSYIRYLDNGTALIVWWEGLHLQDREDAGPFTFQSILNKDGSVIFNYRQVPISIDSINSALHPVKVGLSDAYYIDTKINHNPRKAYTRRTIYEYHKVEIPKLRVTNNTAVVIMPKPTCILNKDCKSCIQADIGFNCSWCRSRKRCSDGYDRKRQDWLDNRCHMQGTVSCFMDPTTTTPPVAIDISTTTPTTPLKTATTGGCVISNNDSTVGKKSKDDCKIAPNPVAHQGFQDNTGGIGYGGIIGIILALFVVVLAVAWFIYAYINPHSKSGLCLIEYRPSMWKSKLGGVGFRFSKKKEGSGESYQVTMQPEGESVA